LGDKLWSAAGHQLPAIPSNLFAPVAGLTFAALWQHEGTLCAKDRLQRAQRSKRRVFNYLQPPQINPDRKSKIKSDGIHSLLLKQFVKFLASFRVVVEPNIFIGIAVASIRLPGLPGRQAEFSKDSRASVL
jgi:hypothetical protein